MEAAQADVSDCGWDVRLLRWMLAAADEVSGYSMLTAGEVCGCVVDDHVWRWSMSVASGKVSGWSEGNSGCGLRYWATWRMEAENGWCELLGQHGCFRILDGGTQRDKSPIGLTKGVEAPLKSECLCFFHLFFFHPRLSCCFSIHHCPFLITALFLYLYSPHLGIWDRSIRGAASTCFSPVHLSRSSFLIDSCLSTSITVAP